MSGKSVGRRDTVGTVIGGRNHNAGEATAGERYHAGVERGKIFVRSDRKCYFAKLFEVGTFDCG